MPSQIVQLPPARSRPRPEPISGIVIHAMGEWIAGGGEPSPAWEFLTARGLSAHAYITPSGVTLRQVADERAALHAGNANAWTLGVEVLVPGVHNLRSLYEAMDQPGWVAPAQMEALVTLVGGWLTRWDLLPVDVRGHSELEPQRKRDPGRGFDWEQMWSLLEAKETDRSV